MNPTSLSIGQLAGRAGCKIETIRYYERIGLMPSPPRTAAGRRVYSTEHARRLMFIRRCRELGFSIEEIRMLLSLVDEGRYRCAEIQALTVEHIRNIQNKITDLKKLEKTLVQIAAQCQGDDIPDCPIIDALYKP